MRGGQRTLLGHTLPRKHEKDTEGIVMATNTQSAHIIVGVDGTPAGNSGVKFAALEAHRLGAALHIVHVTPGYGDAQPELPIIDDGTLTAYGRRLVEEACTTARALVPDLEVETRVVSGGVVPTLAASSKDAAAIVLGAERRSFVSRVWTGDVVAGVAARATCPVLVVAPEWDRTIDHGRVVVGLRKVATARPLLAAGLALASDRNAELVILHAWKLQSGYDDFVTNRVDSDDYGRRETALIEALVNDLRGDTYREVPVGVQVLHAQPAFALVNASTQADRLLISRPRHGGLFHHLGAVARAVLHEARCPVEILPAAVGSGGHDSD